MVHFLLYFLDSFSVHKKKEAFYPNKDQTNAMVLYTLDVLGKIFKK
jgi:hypothetical protein